MTPPVPTRPASAPGTSRLAAGCGMLFLLPFIAVGIGAGIGTVVQAIRGQWAQAGFLAMFAVMFGGAGIGPLIAGRKGMRRAKEQESLEAAHPDEPWLWDQSWASGRITDSTSGKAVMSGLFALAWNLVALPAGYLVLKDIRQHGMSRAIVALLFPLVGLGLMVWAVRATLRYLKYGSSMLVLETLPGVIGREFAGTVTAHLALEPSEGFQVSLTCVNRVTTGSGKNRSTSESILWQDQRTIGETAWRREGGHTVIPCVIPLPGDVQETAGRGSSDKIVWTLTVSGAVPGVDYESVFEVPVFRTAESDTPLPPEEPRALESAAAEKYRQPTTSRIRVTSTRRGLEIYFPPARNPGLAASLTVFTLIWSGITPGLYLLGAPLLFPIVFGAFDLLLLYVVLALWLGTTFIHADHDGLKVTSGLLGIGRPREAPAAGVSSISPAISMTAGSTPYYGLEVVTSEGKKFSAGIGIRDKREAEWLASQIQEALAGTL